jgi:fibronectin type 3 domain-containing protein
VSPSITTQPVSKATNAGSTLSFTVVASGTAPLGYQWYKNTNSLIGGATTAALTLTNVQVSASYDVIVTNAFGSITSSQARLTVLPDAPENLTATPGSKSVVLTFSEVARASFYTIYRSSSNGGPYTKIATTVSSKYTDLKVVSGITYYYVVNACDGLNLSLDSSQTSAAPR